MRWAFSYLGWRANSRALLFGRTPSDGFSATLFQLDLDGKTILLARHKPVQSTQTGYEGADGSLYYWIGDLGANWGRVIRRYPESRFEVICEGFCDIDDQGLLHIWQQDNQVIMRCRNRSRSTSARQHNPQQSPDGQWIIEGKSQLGHSHKENEITPYAYRAPIAAISNCVWMSCRARVTRHRQQRLAAGWPDQERGVQGNRQSAASARPRSRAPDLLSNT